MSLHLSYVGPNKTKLDLIVRYEEGGEKCQGEYLSLDDTQMCNAYSLFRLKCRWTRLPDLLLSNKWIQLFDPLLAQPCTNIDQTTLSVAMGVVSFAPPLLSQSFHPPQKSYFCKETRTQPSRLDINMWFYQHGRLWGTCFELW